MGNHPELGGFDAAYDPVLAFAADGTLYYAGGARNAQMSIESCDPQVPAFNLSVFVAQSSPPYNSFDTIKIVQQGIEQPRLTTDKPWIGVDRTQSVFWGRVYLCWSEGTGSPTRIMLSYSTDRASTWSAPITVFSDSGTQGCQIGIDPNGKVFVAWINLGSDGAYTIKIAKSLDGGGTFSLPQTVAAVTQVSGFNFGTQQRFRLSPGSLPTMAVDDILQGTIYMAWHDGRDESTRCADIFFSKSINEGATWTVPARVNDDSLLPGDSDHKRNDQFFPTMSVSNGIITVGFYDRRRDINNALTDVFVAYSFDRGTTFQPNLQITDVNTNPTIDNGFVEDYITLVSVPTGTQGDSSLVQVVWTDTRNPPDQGPDTVGENQDTWTDRISLTMPPGGSVAAGTLITRADGSKVPVQNLRIGDQLLMVDTRTRASHAATLTSIQKVYADSLLTIRAAHGSPLRVDANPRLRFYVLTESSPVLTSVLNMRPGDMIYHYDLGEWVSVISIEVSYGGRHAFYDLLTDPYLTPDGEYLSFIANGYADPCESPCKQLPVPP